ncbi:MAG: hypothetical protein AAF851_09155 [Myxococcota bacterium]
MKLEGPACRRALIPALGLLLARCGAQEPELRTSFATELLEAPARRLELSFYETTSCDALLALGRGEGGRAFATRTVSYPPRREDQALRDAPDGEYTLELRALDGSGRTVGRACRRVQTGLDPIEVELAVQTRCGPYTRSHLVLVIESSSEMLRADIGVGEQLRPATRELLLSGDMPEGSQQGVISAGSDTELFGRFVGLEEARNQVDATPLTGRSRLWAGIQEGVELLRSEADCRSLPALVVLAGGPEDGSDGTLPIEARLRAEGDPEDPADDVLFVGIALSDPALGALVEAAPSDALLLGAQTESVLRLQLARARNELISRLNGS